MFIGSSLALGSSLHLQENGRAVPHFRPALTWTSLWGGSNVGSSPTERGGLEKARSHPASQLHKGAKGPDTVNSKLSLAPNL